MENRTKSLDDCLLAPRYETSCHNAPRKRVACDAMHFSNKKYHCLCTERKPCFTYHWRTKWHLIHNSHTTQQHEFLFKFLWISAKPAQSFISSRYQFLSRCPTWDLQSNTWPASLNTGKDNTWKYLPKQKDSNVGLQKFFLVNHK